MKIVTDDEIKKMIKHGRIKCSNCGLWENYIPIDFSDREYYENYICVVCQCNPNLKNYPGKIKNYDWEKIDDIIKASEKRR